MYFNSKDTDIAVYNGGNRTDLGLYSGLFIIHQARIYTVDS